MENDSNLWFDMPLILNGRGPMGKSPLQRPHLLRTFTDQAGPRRGISRTRLIFIPAANPEAGFITSVWRAIEPLVQAPQAVQPARERRVSVINDAVRKRESAHARHLADVGCPIGADGCRDLGARTFRHDVRGRLGRRDLYR